MPFDQQYNRTEITHAGEFFAWTIKEAHDMGFRRAMRYDFNIKINEYDEIERNKESI